MESVLSNPEVETLSTELLQKKARVVNVVDLMKMQSASEHTT
ncbi:MAG: hypothetical protein ABIX36_04470 [Mucilaginibacter sp.]